MSWMQKKPIPPILPAIFCFREARKYIVLSIAIQRQCRTMKRNWRLVSMIGLTLIPTLLRAQPSDPIQTSEVSTYTGASIGRGGAHAWVGGSTGVSPSKFFMGVIDASFQPLGDNTLRTGLFGTTTSRLYDFNFTG